LFDTINKEWQKIAKKILEQHTLLSDRLIRLGVSEEVAREDACRIVHDISEETFDILPLHIEIASYHL